MVNSDRPKPRPEDDDWEEPLEPMPGPRRALRHVPVCAACLFALWLSGCVGKWWPAPVF